MQKYFINENIELNKSFKIESSDQHHIEKVMRNKNGDQIICVDLKHIQYLCSIENVQEGTILPIEKLDINNELDVEVTLVYALPKGDKFEFVLQKACELGVHHIIPLSSKRCVVKLTKDKFNKKLPRYQKILKEASEQSKRTNIPIIEDIKSINDLTKEDADLKLVASTKEKEKLLNYYLQSIEGCAKIIMVIGPEGGISDKEEDILVSNGYNRVSFGNLIFRVETATIYVASIINYIQ